jgi:hypothetical protein
MAGSLKTKFTAARRKLRPILAAAGLFASGFAFGANAQPANPAMATAMDAAFERMMADPANLQTTFAYAEAASRAGNYEGAIAALERMLLIDSDLPRVRLELGVLYYRLASYDLARSYLAAAVADPNVPADVRGRVAQFLAEIDKRQSRHKLSGSMLAGVRYQTNATSGYGNTLVPIPAIAGTDPVDIGSGKRDDWNLFAAATATHLYDMGGQSGENWETGLTFYGTRQKQVHTLNTTLVEVNTGPRLSLADYGLENGSLRPYALANAVGLADNRYLHSGGAGLQFANPLLSDLMWTLGTELREKNYRTDATRRTIRQQNGTEIGYTTTLTYLLTQIDSIAGGAGYSRDIARTGVKTINKYNFTLGYTRKQVPPVWLGNEPWTFGVTGGRYISQYMSPDDTIDPDTRRGDYEWRYSGLMGVPLTDTLSFVSVVQRQTVSSSYRINKYRNDSITLGVSVLF